MHTQRRQWTAMGLVAAGVAASWLGLLLPDANPWLPRAAVLLGGMLCLAGLVLFRRQSEFDGTARPPESLTQQMQAELESQAASLERRERDLTLRLMQFHEWMEFPEPTDLRQAATGTQGEQDAAVRELSQRDRQLAELLEAESKQAFENVLANKYVVDGRLHLPLIRDDVYELLRKAAKIYRPDVDHPLLETSLEQLARATSRASLHLLVVLEGLPLKVQQYDIDDMYGWIKQSVKAYGVYRSAQPYMPYVRGGYYLSRIAMSS
ncbi:MAG: hypothetical protein KDA41_09605, partial [Planctomycetales bacterium]|nr:hypothetical protein [Planctomycetales bacterium]